MANSLTIATMRLALSVAGVLAPGSTARLALRLFVRPRRLPRPGREITYLKEAKIVTLGDGLSAAIWDRNNAALGTALLVHGWEGRGTQLGAFIEPLLAIGLRVIALDGPAHGNSPGVATNPMHFAKALIAVGREIGPFTTVICHSFGAASTALALKRGLVVDCVVMVASPSSIVNVLDRFCDFLRLSDRVSSRFRLYLEQEVGLPAAALDVSRLGETLNAPALVVHDIEDTEVPFSDGEAIAASWKNATLLKVAGLGHRRVLKSESVVRAVIDFIQKTIELRWATRAS